MPTCRLAIYKREKKINKKMIPRPIKDLDA